MTKLRSVAQLSLAHHNKTEKSSENVFIFNDTFCDLDRIQQANLIGKTSCKKHSACVWVESEFTAKSFNRVLHFVNFLTFHCSPSFFWSHLMSYS